MGSDFKNCINDTTTTDVEFEIDDRVVSAHRAILVHRCEYFSALLDGQFKEASASRILVGELEYDVFVAGLSFLYTGSVDASNAQNLFDLLYVSNFWHLDQLKAQVETLLLDVLDQTT